MSKTFVESENPFSLTFGKSPELNISRPLQTNEICDAFSAKNVGQQIYMITGVRGFGKTVLMTDIAASFKAKKDWVVIELNPESDLLRDLLDKLYSDRICSGIISSAKVNLSFFGIGVEIEGSPKITSTEVAVERILEQLAKSGKRILIEIDEVTNSPQMRTFASAFQIFIRQNLPVFLLMTGLYENIDDLQNQDTLTFLHRAPKIILRQLSFSAVCAKYKEIFELDDKSAYEMAGLVNGYPFAFQVLGRLTWSRHGDYNSAIGEYRQYLEAYVYDKLWSELSRSDKEFAVAVAKSKSGAASEIKSLLNIDNSQYSVYRQRLIKKGIVNGDNRGELAFTLPMFDRYALMISGEEY